MRKPLNGSGGLVTPLVADLDHAGRVLAEVKTYCDICGRAMPIWPPDLHLDHMLDMHRAAFWPEDLWICEHRKKDPDRWRVEFFYQCLYRRADLYAKLIEAGVFQKPPAQG